MPTRNSSNDWIEALAFLISFSALMLVTVISAKWSFYAAMTLWGSFGMLAPIWFLVWIRVSKNEIPEEFKSLTQIYSNVWLFTGLVIATFLGAAVLSVITGYHFWAFMYVSFMPAVYFTPVLAKLYSLGNRSSGSAEANSVS